jgi:hypothetical protein
MSFETAEAAAITVKNQAGQNDCLNLLSATGSNGMKDFVTYVKDNFNTFDIDKSGAISMPELESVLRNPATTAINRQAASFMTSHFDQMANYIKGDDHGYAPVFDSTPTHSFDYRDLESVAMDGTTKDITITKGDIDAMSFTLAPEERAREESEMTKIKLSGLAIGEVAVVPVVAVGTALLSAIPAAIAEIVVDSTLGAVGVAAATAAAAGVAVGGAVAVAAIVAIPAFVGYEIYAMSDKAEPHTAAIESAHKQRQAMLDSWICAK